MPRMMISFWALVATCFAFGASAQDRIVASDPDGIVAYFQAEGFPIELEVDGQGDPLIQVKYFGTSFSIYFWGCEDNQACQSIQFFSGYQTDAAVDLAKGRLQDTVGRTSDGPEPPRPTAAPTRRPEPSTPLGPETGGGRRRRLAVGFKQGVEAL